MTNATTNTEADNVYQNFQELIDHYAQGERLNPENLLATMRTVRLLATQRDHREMAPQLLAAGAPETLRFERSIELARWLRGHGWRQQDIVDLLNDYHQSTRTGLPWRQGTLHRYLRKGAQR